MKKTIAVLLALVFAFAAFTGCAQPAAQEPAAEEPAAEAPAAEEAPAEEAAPENIQLESLTLYFVPSREPDEIVTITEPLKELLKTEMANQGYDVGAVEIFVGTTYEAVGEALAAGTADIGFGMPGGTYVLYDDGADVILTSTRDGLSKDSDNAKDWNDGQPTLPSEEQAVSYRALMIAGPSEKGQAVAAKVNAGEELTWDDINGLNWSVMNSSSSAGYIYPALWMQERYGKGITDLANAVQSDSYGSAFARLASGQVDALMTYADARRDYEEKWTTEYARTASIWEETNVIGVTPGIYNDTITVSKTVPYMDDALKAALQEAFINIAATPEGQEVIAIYSHNGYQKAVSSEYDNERAAQELIQSLSNYFHRALPPDRRVSAPSGGWRATPEQGRGTAMAASRPMYRAHGPGTWEDKGAFAPFSQPAFRAYAAPGGILSKPAGGCINDSL